MKPFFLRSLLVLGLLFVALQAILWVGEAYIREPNNYLAAMIAKEERLASVPSPRIVFVGGSSSAFGIDSKRVEDSTGLPVVNMGLHGGMGVEYYLNQAQAGIKKGDIIILNLEYQLGKPSIKLLTLAADLHPPTKQYFPNQHDLASQIRYQTSRLQRVFSSAYIKKTGVFSEDKTIFCASCFAENGDLTSHLGRDTLLSKMQGEGDLKEIDLLDYLPQVNKFIDQAKEKGTRVYYAYPPVLRSCYDSLQVPLQRMKNSFQKDLHCELLNAPEDFAYPRSLFFDSVYHLNEKGRQIRTTRLIELLLAKGIKKG